jgi:hypothetical protein
LISEFSSNKSPSRVGAPGGLLSNILEEEGDTIVTPEIKAQQAQMERLTHKHFQSDIDNTCGCKAFENYIIGPIFD